MKYAPYSYSRISKYNQCPRAFKYQYIDKLPREREFTVPLERGSLIHLIFEHHKDINTIRNTDEFKNIVQRGILSTEDIKGCFQVYDNFIKSKPGQQLFGLDTSRQIFSEMYIGLNEDLEICKLDSDNLLLRGYIDAGIVEIKSDTLICIDYKTGKLKTPEQQDWSQLLWYAIGLFSKMPFDKIILGYAYVEHNKMNTKVVHRKDLNKYKLALNQTIGKIESDQVFKKVESPLCNWCNSQEYCMQDKV